jgi:iron complex outermembrane receptor protein
VSKFAYVALCGAAMSLAVSAPSMAQDAAAMTSGGDVTAEEATPLPPVVVEAPSQPLARKQQKSTGSAGSAPAATAPQQEGPVSVDGSGGATGTAGVGIYTLGQLDLIGGSTITNEAMWTFNKNSLDEAVSILPGVTVQNSGGSRNERDILVRGFDRFRVPLYMDGVRIYLPYDNRLDFNRFLTPDLSEVQVQKGYVSVLNGPGGMGGAINLVSRKPTKEVELEGRVGAVLDGDLGSMGQWNAYAFGGTRQKGYYAQISGTIVDQDHFDMSGDFTPAGPGTTGYTAGPAFYAYEKGGNRDRSGFEDWRINAKVGITPNATDEYSINYTKQQSDKEAPLHSNRQVVQGYFFGNNPRFWDWPQWDISTLSWLSKTQIGDASYIKSNAYYNTFKNMVSFYRTRDYTTKLADSPYDDSSFGGFIEMGTDLIPMNTLKGTIHWRRDAHWEQGVNYDANNNITTIDPAKQLSEETTSFAVENTFHATRYLDVVTGASYDLNEVTRADGSLQPLPELDNWNWQSAAIYSYSREGKVHADVSSRTRFPTLFDRYSTRFGGRTEEPGLDAERATNYEIGVSDTFFDSVRVSSAAFYSDIESLIQTAFTASNGNNSLVVYNADGDSRGFELSINWDTTRTLRIGGNYTYLDRDVDFAGASQGYIAPPGGNQATARSSIAASQVEGTPTHSAFFYASWRATPQLTLTPSLELAGDRTVLVTSCDSTLVALGNTNNQQQGACGKAAGTFTGRSSYVDIGSYAMLNFQAEYAFDPKTTVAVGVTNLLDQNYALADGFPEPGRQFYATARAKF